MLALTNGTSNAHSRGGPWVQVEVHGVAVAHRAALLIDSRPVGGPEVDDPAAQAHVQGQSVGVLVAVRLLRRGLGCDRDRGQAREGWQGGAWERWGVREGGGDVGGKPAQHPEQQRQHRVLVAVKGPQGQLRVEYWEREVCGGSWLIGLDSMVTASTVAGCYACGDPPIHPTVVGCIGCMNMAVFLLATEKRPQLPEHLLSCVLRGVCCTWPEITSPKASRSEHHLSQWSEPDMRSACISCCYGGADAPKHFQDCLTRWYVAHSSPSCQRNNATPRTQATARWPGRSLDSKLRTLSCLSFFLFRSLRRPNGTGWALLQCSMAK